MLASARPSRSRSGRGRGAHYNERTAVEGRVEGLPDGRLTYSGPFARGVTGDMGRSAVLGIGRVKVVLHSRSVMEIDPSPFVAAGLDPMQADVLQAKSHVSFRAGYADVTDRAVVADTPGPTMIDLDADAVRPAPTSPVPLRGPHRPRSGGSSMTQRTALVTGTAQGIGRAIAEALASDGHRVIGIDVRDQDAGSMVRTIRADLAEPAAIEAIADEVQDADILVNNAAILVEKPIEDMTIVEFDRTIAVNLRAPFLLSRAIGAGMKERGWGRIINISSVGARTGAVSQAAVYAATKAGLIALTKNFARNYGPFGVTVNAVAPGADRDAHGCRTGGGHAGPPGVGHAADPAATIRAASRARRGRRVPRLGRRELRDRSDRRRQRRLVHVLGSSERGRLAWNEHSST